MTRSFAFASVLSLSFLFGSAACAPDSGVDSSEASVDDESALSLNVQVLDVSKSAADPGLTIITKKADYVAFFGKQPPSNLNFNSRWVLHYSTGVQNTGGFRASITGVERIGSGQSAILDIHTQDTSPGPNCAVTMALTNPQITVTIPKQNKAIGINQINDQIVTDCGTVQNWCAAALCGPGERCDEFQDACVEQDFCPHVKCANGYQCDEEQNACVGRQCDPDDSNSCPSGFICDNNIVCITTPCPADFRCEPAPEVTCEQIGWEGICQGPTLKYCDGDEMIVTQCSPSQCTYDEANGYYDCL